MSDSVYFIYDGECPICHYGAHTFRIRQATGELLLLDARQEQDHALVREVNKQGLDLDEGMVIVYQGNFYHGADALHFMALTGSNAGWFNKANAFLFRTKSLAKFFYPAMRGTRNLLLRIKEVPRIDNLRRSSIPIFQPIFGKDWERLPPVMKKHYANRPYHEETTAVEGTLKIESSTVGNLLFPLFRMMKTLIPRTAEKVRTTVHFVTTESSDAFQFDRSMHFPDGMSYRFHSRMKPVGGNELVEFMRFGVGWRMAYSWNGEKVILAHRGYVLDLFGLLVPLPLGLILGKGYAEEIPLNDNEFSMMTEIRHPLWGKVYGYSGTFRVTKEA